MTEPLFGILNLSKPQYVTSRAVVTQIERLVRPAKAGHAGTLDPMATGVLLVCVGRATRLVSRIQHLPKTYRTRFVFGRRSSTDDKTGDIEVVTDKIPSTKAVTAALAGFRGELRQVPPDFSAAHVNGQRAYRLARRGRPTQLRPKTVFVSRFELLSRVGDEFEFEIECGSGTYIRSLARDLGEQLGCGGLMSFLHRSSIGPFHSHDAFAVEEVSAENLSARLQSPIRAVESMPRHICSRSESERLRLGRTIPAPQIAVEDEIAVVDESGMLIGIAVPTPGLNELKPRLIFHAIQ